MAGIIVMSALLAEGSRGDIVVIVVIAIIAGIVNLVKWLRRKQEEREAEERRLRRGESEAPASESGQPRRVGGLASLLQALEESSKQQGSRAEEEGWQAVGDASEAEEPAMHEVEREVWDVDGETRERGLATIDPQTLELQRRRDRERQRRESFEAAAAKVAEKEHEARRAVEQARRAAAARPVAAPAEDYAERVLAREAKERAKRLAGVREGARALAAGTSVHDASRQAVRRGMVWSFILGTPRAITPYAEEEAGGVPGLKV